jgi:hypothetical protein
MPDTRAWFKVGRHDFDFFLYYFTQTCMPATVGQNMRLVYYRNGLFQAYDLPPRTRSNACAVEEAIRSFANENGDIRSISIRIGNETIPICHVDEARIVSRMLVADHDCFTDHLYDKGFEPLESSKSASTATDAYSANEIWKLEFEYEQNEDLGTPSFGSAQAHADVY